MSIWLALLSVFSGYFLGGISFARIIGARVMPGEDISTTEFGMAGTDKKFELKSVSATSIAMRGGAKLGCLTSILDMAKVFAPTLLFKLLFPTQPYFLIVAAAGVAGHNFPIYYRFKGGRGVSPLYGGLLIIDWLAIPVSFLLSNLIGLGIFRDMFLAYTGGVLVLIPWFLWRFYGEPAYLIYAISVNIFFWPAILPELKMYYAYMRAGEIDRSKLLDAMEEGYGGSMIRMARERGWIKEEISSQDTVAEADSSVNTAKSDLIPPEEE